MSADSLGVVIGKFLPFHHGHQFLVESACRGAGQVTVIVCDQAGDPIPGAVRGAWIRELYPAVKVLVIDDHYDPHDSVLWGRLTIEWLGRRPDVVFTSEEYGPRYAAAMECAHVAVDPPRLTVPCSGTEVRADPYAMWDFIAPPVRAWFAKRVCVLGAESTGTTTLAMALAEHYHTTWVAEYGREYSEQKMASGDDVWRSEEFVRIAEAQNRREDRAAREADRVLICDTNSFATNVWHRRYVGGLNAEVGRLAVGQRCDLYLLTGDEIPFVQDGLRDGAHIRHEMHGWFVGALERQGVPWLLLRGSREERLAAGVRAVNALFADSAWKGWAG